MANKKKIMIVDDNEDFLTEIEEVLSLSGYETVKYTSGESALQNIEKDKPDLVLLDLRMDGISGFDVAKTINKDPAIKTRPIIAMTGYYTSEEYHSLMKISGMQECLVKPFNPLDVLMKIEKTLP